MNKKMVSIWDSKLEITKHESGFIINDKSVDLMIHADAVNFSDGASANGANWLWLFSRSGLHIGSIWISTDTDIQKVKEFLEEVK